MPNETAQNRFTEFFEFAVLLYMHLSFFSSAR